MQKRTAVGLISCLRQWDIAVLGSVRSLRAVRLSVATPAAFNQRGGAENVKIALQLDKMAMQIEHGPHSRWSKHEDLQIVSYLKMKTISEYSKGKLFVISLA